MKKLLFLLLVLVTFTACKEEKTKHPDYKIEFKDKKITLNSEGKAVASCTVFPEDLDISKLVLQTKFEDISQRTDDMEWSSVNITSVIKDQTVKGNWLVSFGPTSHGDSKPYVLKPEYSYYLEQKSVGAIQVQSDGGYPVVSNKFTLFLDIPKVQQ